jgi:hypothetical protein
MDNMKDHDVCGLITFNGEVSLFGDGKSPTIIGGDELNDLEALKKRGRNGSMGETLERSREQLKKHLWSLQTGGQTALGPAVAVSLSVAANHPGSTVIIATDGLANVGVGDLQSVTTPEDISASKRFYESMATFAQEHSVIVNVLSLASVGENVNLSILGLLNSKTGGTIDLVDPHSIIQQVHEMANSEPIATDVSIAILSHRTFHFIDSAAADTHKSDEESVGKEEGKEKKEKKEKEEEEEEEGVLRCEFLVRKYVGVVSRRTEIPFQFEINRDESDVLPEYLPFQVCNTREEESLGEYLLCLSHFLSFSFSHFLSLSFSLSHFHFSLTIFRCKFGSPAWMAQRWRFHSFVFRFYSHPLLSSSTGHSSHHRP